MSEKKRRFTPVARKLQKRSVRLVKQSQTKPTNIEEKLWKMLRDGRCLGLKFRRQEAIRGYIADFYCAELGLVLELDTPITASQRDLYSFRKLMFGYMGLNEVIVGKDDMTKDRLIAKIKPFLEK